MKIYSSITELIGHTPLLRLSNFERERNSKAAILGKIEFFNPAGSAKDRVARKMISQAEEEGLLSPGAVIIEPTSGNTGIGLCAIAASKGYKAIIVMPDTMSKERIDIMKAYGAEVVLSDGKKGMAGAIEKADELKASTPGAFIPGQFTSSANPAAHYETTGPEIWEDTDGTVDIFVCCVGTGGTVTGTGKYLKEKNPNIKVIGIEPAGSAILSGGSAGVHKIQGIGAGFVPDILDTTVYDEIVTVTDEDAYNAAAEIAKCDGIFVGISSGAALHAAAKIAAKEENKDKTVVVFLPDTGERYLSTPDFIR